MPNDPIPGDPLEILPEEVPVAMPNLPMQLVVRDEIQVKAAFDPLRGRVLHILHDRPATARQLATHLRITPSLMAYHLRILEEAGLIQLVAQRLVHGIVAKYYTRTAQVFVFRPPVETAGMPPVQMQLLEYARDELLETLPSLQEQDVLSAWFPHMRLSPERMHAYVARLTALVDDFLHETPEPEGQVFGLFATAFLAPPALQVLAEDPADENDAEDA